MDEYSINPEERKCLLKIAREAVEAAANGRRPAALDLQNFPAALRSVGASFVTLTENGRLRGCIGALEAHQPLALDVQEHAAAAAVEDFRFSPVHPEEVSRLHIEISRLTEPVRLEYEKPFHLPDLLRPGVDGVILSDGRRRATFLPQVWEQLPDCEDFMAHLCQKMGVPGNLWKTQHLEIWTYQVEAFEEE